jgi:type IV pilus assembly protein PilX
MTTRFKTHLNEQRTTVRPHQGGMTLLVGLILLLMLTVIGTIGFRNTTMSERMTGNSVDRAVSFQSAESAGREALTVIEASLFNPTTTIGHYATPTIMAQGGTTNFWTQGDGATVALPAANCATTTPFSWTSCSAPVAAKYTNNSVTATYVIELLTTVPSASTTISTYRVTSRSTGGTGNADVVIQTIYSRSP